MAIELTSVAFRMGEPIPKSYTGDGKNISPALRWSEPPPATISFALICEDPNAPHGTFTHWVLFNLPADCRELKEGVSKDADVLDGANQGKNDFGKIGYGGPSPPKGKPHRYFFKLYALDRRMEKKSGASRNQLLAAMKGHVLDEREIMGTYQRG